MFFLPSWISNSHSFRHNPLKIGKECASPFLKSAIEIKNSIVSQLKSFLHLQRSLQKAFYHENTQVFGPESFRLKDKESFPVQTAQNNQKGILHFANNPTFLMDISSIQIPPIQGFIKLGTDSASFRSAKIAFPGK